MNIITQLFHSSGFMPHGHCYLWDPGILWLHVLSDGLIGLAYFMIPYSLVYIIRKRKPVQYSWMYVLFGLFIFSCGLTHLMSIVTVWQPYYRLDGMIKAITALASVGTAIALVHLMPTLVSLPTKQAWENINDQLQEHTQVLSQREQELEQANEQLKRSNAELQRSQQQIGELNRELEMRVRARTAELQATLEELRRFSRLVENSQDFISYASIEGKLLYVNAAGKKLLGIADEQRVDALLTTDLAFPEDHDRFQEEIISAIVEKGSWRGEVRMRHLQTNAPVFMDNITFLIRDEETQIPTLMATVSRDLTSYKQMEQALRNNEARLRLLTDSLPVLIGYIDSQQRYRFNNRAYQDWFGYSPEQLYGKPVIELFTSQDYTLIQQAIDQAMAGSSVHFEKEVVYPKLGPRFVLIDYIPHREDDRVVGLFILVQDITDSKRTEQALQAALQHTQSQNEQLSRINTDLDNFVYAASHDLRAPVLNIEGLLSLLKLRPQGAADVDEKALLAYMEQATAKLKRTVFELAEVAKLQKEDDLIPEAIDLVALLEDIKADIAPLIEQAKPEIEVNFEVREFNFPRKHLRSILYNLLSNALKYRDPQRTIRVLLGNVLQGKELLFTVSDNGLGLDTDQTEKIFGMFKRMHTHVEGSGVGLYMVKRMIENQGGRIRVESEKGKGSTFYVTLPLREQ